MTVKVYRSTDKGAPLQTGQLGSFVAMLDAILVNGYGSTNVTSITRVSATATISCVEPHGLATGDVALIAGATPIEYNGEKTVTVIDGSTFTVSVTGSPATPATGTITVRRAPAGFAKPFSGSNKAVYRSNDISSMKHYFRIDDTGGGTGGAREVRLRGYESMTDVDTGTNPFPTIAQSVDGYFYIKSNVLTSDPRAWCLISDGKTIYLFSEYQYSAEGGLSNSGNFYNLTFGDFISFKQGDVFASIITGVSSKNSTTNPNNGIANQYTAITSTTSFSSSITVARDFTALPGARYVSVYASGLNATLGASKYIDYPHIVDNGFYMTPVLLTQGAPSVIRGRLPGAFESMHGACINNGDIIENVEGLPGRKIMLMLANNASTKGSIMIDITGPWE